MLGIFMIAFMFQLSFNYRHNKQYNKMYPNNKFIKEWMANTNSRALRRRRRRRRSPLKVSSISNFEDRELVNIKRSWEKFPLVRRYSKISTKSATFQKFKRPKIELEGPSSLNNSHNVKSATSEIPIIRVYSSDVSETYSSHDSNKTY